MSLLEENDSNNKSASSDWDAWVKEYVAHFYKGYNFHIVGREGLKLKVEKWMLKNWDL